MNHAARSAASSRPPSPGNENNESLDTSSIITDIITDSPRTESVDDKDLWSSLGLDGVTIKWVKTPADIKERTKGLLETLASASAPLKDVIPADCVRILSIIGQNHTDQWKTLRFVREKELGSDASKLVVTTRSLQLKCTKRDKQLKDRASKYDEWAASGIKAIEDPIKSMTSLIESHVSDSDISKANELTKQLKDLVLAGHKMKTVTAAKDFDAKKEWIKMVSEHIKTYVSSIRGRYNFNKTMSLFWSHVEAIIILETISRNNEPTSRTAVSNQPERETGPISAVEGLTEKVFLEKLDSLLEEKGKRWISTAISSFKKTETASIIPNPVNKKKKRNRRGNTENAREPSSSNPDPNAAIKPTPIAGPSRKSIRNDPSAGRSRATGPDNRNFNSGGGGGNTSSSRGPVRRPAATGRVPNPDHGHQSNPRSDRYPNRSSFRNNFRQVRDHGSEFDDRPLNQRPDDNRSGPFLDNRRNQRQRR